jgi:hypothetical protein
MLLQRALATLLVTAWFAVAGPASAQTTVVSPTAAQRCLTRGELTLGTPTYPQDAYTRRAGGRVMVELEFESPDAKPRVKVVDAEGEQAFEEAVRTFVDAYRVPCLGSGQKTQLRQEFVFRPTDGRRVAYMEPIDADEQRHERMRACIAHLRPEEKVSYPGRALRLEEYGTVVLKLEFSDAQNAPRIVALDTAGSSSLARAATEHAERYRMPCHSGGPVEFVQFYQFKLQGDARYVLTDLPLIDFLRNVKGIQKANVYFDFKTMGCPFEFRLKLHRPHTANDVGEFGGTNPERRFFLDWVRRQELELEPKVLNAVLGQQMTVSVPCSVLSLGATTGGGASQ